MELAKRRPIGLQELYTGIESIREARYAMAAMCALQLYEWLVLLDSEIYLIHKSHISMINFCYMLCRYYPAALWVLVMWGVVGNHPKELCIEVVKPIYALLLPCQFISQGVVMMRAYAFTSRNRRVLSGLSICYATLIGIYIWAFSVFIRIPVGLYKLLGRTGCFGVMGMGIGYTIIAATLMDFISLTVVFMHCYRARAREVSLGRYFVNQGLTAFAFVCVINVVCAMLYFKPPSFTNGIGLPLILVLPNIVACRVILKLRQHCKPPTLSELSARTPRIVRDAVEQRNPDAWTMT